MATKVILGNKEYPQGFLSESELIKTLRKVSPPYIFLNDIIDPLVYNGFGRLLRALDKPYVLCTSLAGYPGYLALKGNGIGGDRTFVKNCEMIHAFHISPQDGGSFSLTQFLERLKHLVIAKYPITLYVPRSIKMEGVPYVLRDWLATTGAVQVGKWEDWLTVTGARKKRSCQGEQCVLGPKGLVYPCLAAVGGSFGKGIYAGPFEPDENGVISHPGREKCSLRRCPNDEHDAEVYGSYRFVQTTYNES